jgi:hypothetical protein
LHAAILSIFLSFSRARTLLENRPRSFVISAPVCHTRSFSFPRFRTLYIFFVFVSAKDVKKDWRVDGCENLSSKLFLLF